MRSFLFGFFSASVQSVTQPCLTLCDPMDHSTLGLPVHHQLPDFTKTHIHSVGDAIQPSHPLLSLSPPAFNFSQHQGHCHLFPPRNPSLCLFFGCFLGFQAVGSSFIHCFSSVCVCFFFFFFQSISRLQGHPNCSLSYFSLRACICLSHH